MNIALSKTQASASMQSVFTTWNPTTPSHEDILVCIWSEACYRGLLQPAVLLREWPSRVRRLVFAINCYPPKGDGSRKAILPVWTCTSSAEVHTGYFIYLISLLKQSFNHITVYLFLCFMRIKYMYIINLSQNTVHMWCIVKIQLQPCVYGIMCIISTYRFST